MDQEPKHSAFVLDPIPLRDEDERRHYEETVSYSFPDLESFDSEQPDAQWNRLNLRQASIAVDPCHAAHSLSGK